MANEGSKTRKFLAVVLQVLFVIVCITFVVLRWHSIDEIKGAVVGWFLNDSITEERGVAEPYTSLRVGTYKVGTDIPAGEYVIFGSGYMQVSSDSNGNNIITNDNYKNIWYITVKERTYLEFNDGKAYPIDSAPGIDISSGILPDGMYKVGRDFPAGEYKVSAFASGYLAVLNNSLSSHGMSIVSNENFNGDRYVTVQNGQYLHLDGCELYLPAVSGISVENLVDGNVEQIIANEFPKDLKILETIHDETSQIVGQVGPENTQWAIDNLTIYRNHLNEINGKYVAFDTELSDMITDVVVPVFYDFLDAAEAFFQAVANMEKETLENSPSRKRLEDFLAVKTELLSRFAELIEVANTQGSMRGSFSSDNPASSILNTGNENETSQNVYLVTAYDDSGIFVRDKPSARDDSNKILYIEPGDRSVRLLYKNKTEVSENGEAHTWYQVVLPDGRTGWIRDDVVINEASAPAGNAAVNSQASEDFETVSFKDLVDNPANYSGKYVKLNDNLIIMYQYHSSTEQFFTVYLVQSELVNTDYHFMIDYSKCTSPRAASALADENAYVSLEGTVMKYPGENTWYLEAAIITRK
jgi:hypothetical protein